MSATSRKATREALYNKGKWMPKDMAYGDRTQQNWKNQNDGRDIADPVGIVEGLQEMSDNDIIINYLCNATGGYFIRASEITERSKCLHSQVAKFIKYMSNTVTTVVDSASDHIITDSERANIKNSFNELMEVGEQFLEEVDRGEWR